MTSTNSANTPAGELSIQDELGAAILRSVAQAKAAGRLPNDLAVPESITLDRPKNRDHGDYATSIALALAKPAGLAPRDVASIVSEYLNSDEATSRGASPAGLASASAIEVA